MKQKILMTYYQFLARCARGYLKRHKPIIIGINGSVGKTTARAIIFQTLQQFIPSSYSIYSSPKNFNGELGMSLSIFCVEQRTPTPYYLIKIAIVCLYQRFFGTKKYDIILLEYGIDRPQEMEFLLSIAKPHYGVFTKLDSVHSLQFGDPQKIANEEVKMILWTQEIAYLNSNDTYARQLHSMLHIDAFYYRTALENDVEKNDLDFCNTHLHHEKNILWNHATLRLHDQEISIKTNLIEKQNLWYIAVALSISDAIVYKLTQQSLFTKKTKTPLTLEYTLLPGRFSLFAWVADSLIIDSSYNASPKSMRKTIENVFRLQKDVYPDHKVVVVFGEMRELGDFEEKEHRQIAPILDHVADYIYFVGNAVAHTIDELQKIWTTKDIVHFVSSREAGEAVKKLLQQSDQKFLVLCKWSQNTIFLEETVQLLLADPKNSSKLVRQSNIRQKKKEAFFSSLNKQ